MRTVRSFTVMVAVMVASARPAAAAPFVRVDGGAFTVSTDASGTFAYAANDSIVVVLDIAARRIVRQFPTTGVSDGGVVDPSGILLPVFGFDVAGVLDVGTGTERILLTPAGFGGAYQAATIANGKLYAAAFNGRVVHAVPLTGGEPATIDPYAGLPGVVGTPCEVVASPDGTTVLMGEENHNVVHAIRTTDDAIVATYAVGFAACRLFYRDAHTAVAVNAGQGVWADSKGDFALLNLDDPNDVAVVRRVRRLRRLQAAAVDPGGRLLLLLYGGEPGGDEGIQTPVAPRLGVVRLATQRPRARIRLPRVRGFAAAVAITPDAGTALVGTTLGIQYVRLRRH